MFTFVLNLQSLPINLNIGSIFAQSQELLDHSWFVHSITVNSEVIEAPLTPEMKIRADFSNNLMLNDLCCAGVLELEIEFDDNLSVFEISNLTNILENCTQESNAIFSNIFTDFFQNTSDDFFTYTVNSSESFSYLSLSITNSQENEILFYNTPHNLVNFYEYTFFDSTGPVRWYLTGMKIDNINYSYTYNNEEFNHITLEFLPNGTFYATACSTLTGQATIFSDASSGGICFINCDYTEQSTNVCTQPQNSNIESLFMSFFTENSSDVWTLTIYIADPIKSGGWNELVIQAPSGDALFLVDTSLFLSTDDFTTSTINIFPNPVSEILYIQNSNPISIKSSLYSINGKLLQTIKTPIQEIDVKKLNNGVYFLVIETNSGEKFSKKIIKQ
jgi:hypothetical protein